MAFKICSTQAQFVAPDGSIGYVRTIDRRPVRVPAQSEVLLWGRTRAGPSGKDYQCLVEPEERENADPAAQTPSSFCQTG